MNPLQLPLVAAQGLWVRHRTVAPPEASGPLTGTVDVGPAGDEPPLRVLVLGESTAAGCGAPTHEVAFTGAFARALSEQHARPVQWSVHGRYGATIRRVRYRVLPELDDTGVDVAALLIGVNDVLVRTAPQKWSDDLAAVLDTLAARASTVVLTGVPPFDAVPALPRALRGYLAERGRRLDDVARRLCRTRPQTRWIDSTDIVPAAADHFAEDGFHPSPDGYRSWARAVSSRLIRVVPVPQGTSRRAARNARRSPGPFVATAWTRRRSRLA